MPQQELFTEHEVLRADGIQSNSLSLSGLCHLSPILATISLFSSTKPPKWPIRSRTLWLGLRLRSYFHSCRLPSNPSTACIQHHCEMSWPLIYPLMWLWRTEKQRRKAGEGVWISWVCVENSNLSNPEASRSRVKPAEEWSPNVEPGYCRCRCWPHHLQSLYPRVYFQPLWALVCSFI